jgi:nucleoid-associated protein YgaU
VPVFDIVRVQPDGSMVIAGRANAGTAIDVIAGERVLGSTTTDESGAFAFVLEQPLSPGDYSIGLVAKDSGKSIVSAETAVVQIPEKPDGDVLAIVTAPDSAPEIVAAGSAETKSPETVVTTALETPAAGSAPASAETGQTIAPVPVAADSLRIASVEASGEVTIISGAAPAGSTVRLYAGETLLGDTTSTAAGVFELTTKGVAATAANSIRADLIDAAKGTVVARVAVPFEPMLGEPVIAGVSTENAAPATSDTNPVVTATATQTVAVTAPQEPSDTSTPGEGKLEIPAADFALGTNPEFSATTSVVIRKGDTLWQIARKVYGRGVTFSTIYNANTGQIIDPNRIWPGQVFTVPVKTEAGEAADFSSIADRKKVDIAVD